MTDMDIENIFNLFNHNKKEEPKETPPTVIEMEQFEKTPTYKIGMFKRIILNQSMFSKKIISMFKDSDDEFETEDLEDMSEYLAHHRAWSYIKDCDIDSELWNGSLVIQHDDYLDTSIKLSISFFEDVEEYEKCAFLVKIQKYLKDSLESQS